MAGLEQIRPQTQNTSAIVDIDEAKRNEFAGEFVIKSYKNLKEMLSDSEI